MERVHWRLNSLCPNFENKGLVDDGKMHKEVPGRRALAVKKLAALVIHICITALHWIFVHFLGSNSRERVGVFSYRDRQRDERSGASRLFLLAPPRRLG